MKTAGRYFSVIMAMLMLMMSIGVTAHKMVCLVSGAVTFSFLEKSDCCPTEETDSHSATTKCCDYSTDYFRLDIQTLVTSFNFKVDLFTAYFTIPVFLFNDITTNQLNRFLHPPPIATGTNILALVSVFRI